MSATVRPERPTDHAAVADLLHAAFPTDYEARLVARLRSLVTPLVSLVAEEEGRVVGHVLFSPVTIVGEQGESTAMGLGPMAVLPGRQRRGIGGHLVRAGLEACRALGEELVFVLGHAEYYPRFGFEPAAPRGLRYQGPEFDPYFFVLELVPGALAGRTGRVHYHPAFDDSPRGTA